MNNKKKSNTVKKEEPDLTVEFTKFYSGSPSNDCLREAAFRKEMAEYIQRLQSATQAKLINLEPKERALLLDKLAKSK